PTLALPVPGRGYVAPGLQVSSHHAMSGPLPGTGRVRVGAFTFPHDLPLQAEYLLRTERLTQQKTYPVRTKNQTLTRPCNLIRRGESDRTSRRVRLRPCTPCALFPISGI